MRKLGPVTAFAVACALVTATPCFALIGQDSVSLESASLINNAPFLDAHTDYVAMGVRYTVDLVSLRMWNKGPVGSVAAEVGAFGYRVMNFEDSGRDYFVPALSGNLRFSARINRFLQPFVYSGVLQNLGGDRLNATVPALGAGLFVHVGQNWAIAGRAGTDTLAGSISYWF